MKVLHVFTIINTPKSFFDGQFKYLSENGQNIWVVTNSDEDINFSRNNNIHYRQIEIARKISPITDLKSIKQLISLIHREKFDIVVGHTPKGAMVGMLASKIARVKVRVYYRHGLIYTTAKGLKRKMFKLVEQLTSICATNIINVSPSLSELAIKDKLNSSKKQTIIGIGTCGGIDTQKIFNPAFICEDDKIQLKATLGMASSDFVVGFCGRICKDKGIKELIDGFTQFRTAHPDINPKLLLVGSFDKRDILPENYKCIIETDANIIFTGLIEKSKLPIYYSIMDVFVFPSYREGFGMCVIEAEAMKVPALVSRSHGCIDSIKENQTGEYLEISPRGICTSLENMLDLSKRQSYGNAARNWVLENFDHSVMWPKIIKLYSYMSDDFGFKVFQ